MPNKLFFWWVPEFTQFSPRVLKLFFDKTSFRKMGMKTSSFFALLTRMFDLSATRDYGAEYTCFEKHYCHCNPFFSATKLEKNSVFVRKIRRATAAHNSTRLIRFPVFNAMGIFFRRVPEFEYVKAGNPYFSGMMHVFLFISNCFPDDVFRVLRYKNRSHFNN